ncbi:MAG: FecR domain-containing protein [Asticcacaulis sp.]
MTELNDTEIIAEEARRWIARLASGDMQPAELEALRQWRASRPEHETAFGQQRRLWRNIQPSGAQVHVLPRKTTRAGFDRRLMIGGAMAAALAVAWIAPELMLMARADYQTGAQTRHLTLADGSRAVLDAGSAISVDFKDDERRIELLRGQAWFEVKDAHNRPFRVSASGGVTEDIGTAFVVERRDDAVSVAVSEGVVLVSHKADSDILREGQQAQYDRQGLRRLPDIKTEDVAPWRQGEILLSQVTVASAIDAIRPYRQAPVIILGKLPETETLSGVFRTDKPDEALEAIVLKAGGTIRKLPGGVMIVSR